MKPESKKKVLLVDDDRDFIEINRSLLKKHGFDVFAAYNARECMDMVKKVDPDIIVLDIMMESITDGFTIARELHNHSDTKGIPIIIVTGITNKRGFEWENKNLKSRWLPIDNVLEKPVTPNSLLSEIDKKLGNEFVTL